MGDEDEGLRAADDTPGVNWDAGAEWSVAETQKGNLVMYWRHCNGRFAPRFKVYEKFAEMAADQSEQGMPAYPKNVLAPTAAALNIDFEEELDI